ncbi:peptidoglycan-binding domain-containing protein [Planktotalea sp.]|uniref:peptidoglycan-binding domain-containing protein n=1 Tax=Planktotalea sp. TaxID=2029877 RepID=UPI003D6C5F69
MRFQFVCFIYIFIASLIPFSAHAFTKDAVKCVQNQLNDTGFEAGSVDGLVGGKTRRALDKFQAEYGELSKRRLSRNNALVYCRLIALRLVHLKKHWLPSAGHLTIVFGDSFFDPEKDQMLMRVKIRLLILEIYNKIKSDFAMELAAPIKIVVAGSHSDATKMYNEHTVYRPRNHRSVIKRHCSEKAKVGAFALPRLIVLCFHSDETDISNKEQSRRREAIAHEIVHAYQYQLSGTITTSSQSTFLKSVGPSWLIEGSAQAYGVHLAYRVSPAAAVPFLKKAADKPVPALSSVDSRADLEARLSDTYFVGHLAMSVLLPDNDFRKLILFYEELGRTGSWKPAFETTFGQSYEEFREKFRAKYR